MKTFYFGPLILIVVFPSRPRFSASISYRDGQNWNFTFMAAPRYTGGFIHEPLNKAGLAKALREAWAWFYPTYWGETYCIAALEAQAAGTPCITVPLGALDETVKGGILSYDFVNSISQLRNKNRWNKLSAAGKEFAADKDWDDRADQWIEMIKAHMPPGVPGV
jgi:glycosyltransferase involved in cell wall biosynthesis